MADAPPEPVDPVLARRRRIGRLAEVGQRIGYSLFGLAFVFLVIALLTDLPPGLITATVASLAIGSVFLAPAIVAAYGVRAADREDRERAS